MHQFKRIGGDIALILMKVTCTATYLKEQKLSEFQRWLPLRLTLIMHYM